MDPDANLEGQLQLADWLSEYAVPLDDSEMTFAQQRQQAEIADKAQRLAELVLALDEWINKGGALPARWVKKS